MLNIRKFAVATGILVIMLSAAGCHHKRPKNAGVVVPVPQLWEKGQKALRKGHTVTARRYFDEISLRNDAGKYKDKAAIATADSYYQEHNIASYAEAITRYQSFLAFHPTSTDAPYCQYMIGQAYLEEVETPDRDVTPAQKAREAFQNLLENYPDSSYGKKAEAKLKEVNNVLAAHEIKVGDFYLKHKDYKGAVARYRVVLKKYPGYWNMPLVYFRLGEALLKSNNTKEASLYFTKVQQEAGGSALGKQAGKRLKQIKRHEIKEHERENKALKEPLLKQKKKKHWWQFWRHK